MKSKQVEHTLLEKKILQCIRLEFLVCLDYSFKVLHFIIIIIIISSSSNYSVFIVI